MYESRLTRTQYSHSTLMISIGILIMEMNTCVSEEDLVGDDIDMPKWFGPDESQPDPNEKAYFNISAAYAVRFCQNVGIHIMFDCNEGNFILDKMLHRDIGRANLTSLLSWIDWAQQMKDELLKKRSNVEQNKGPIYFEGQEVPGTREEILGRLDKALTFVDSYLSRMETELRKPNKNWNYPKADGKP